MISMNQLGSIANLKVGSRRYVSPGAETITRKLESATQKYKKLDSKNIEAYFTAKLPEKLKNTNIEKQRIPLNSEKIAQERQLLKTFWKHRDVHGVLKGMKLPRGTSVNASLK